MKIRVKEILFLDVLEFYDLWKIPELILVHFVWFGLVSLSDMERMNDL